MKKNKKNNTTREMPMHLGHKCDLHSFSSRGFRFGQSMVINNTNINKKYNHIVNKSIFKLETRGEKSEYILSCNK